MRIRSRANHLSKIAPPQRCDIVWVADITYVQTATRWLYLAAIMDLCSRRVIDLATATTLATTIVLSSPEPAVGGPSARSRHHRPLRPRHPVCQHTLPQRSGSPWLHPLMSRRDNCYDNAAMESFWSTLKLKHLFRRREGFYNSRLLHSALGYRTPLDFESVSN